jgi:hypothetical protein
VTRRALFATTLALLAPAALPPSPATAGYGPTPLADSTVIEGWRLANGLRVVTRHIPGCRSVDVTIAYPFGSADDPAGREGLNALLAEVDYFGATAESPGRTRDQMPGLRPAGWNLAILPRAIHMSELCPAGKFPGVLHQVAVRLRGVAVTAPTLRGATASVRADLDGNYRGAVDRALYYAAREWSLGGGRMARRAGGAGLNGLTPAEVQKRISAAFVPSNAVLSIAGDLAGFKMRALIQNEFGSIPPGTPLPPAARERLDSASVAVARPEVGAPVGVVGIITPALSDTTHPAFLMQLLLAGGHATERWGPPAAPLTSRFQYSILDDPRVARFYPPLAHNATAPGDLSREVIETFSELDAVLFDQETTQSVWRGVDWILGGPLPPPVARRALTDPSALYTVGSGMALRELWGGEPFWSEYRRRFRDAVKPPFVHPFQWMATGDRVVAVLFVPKK